MTNNNHPITPPPELIQQWFLEAKAMPVDQWVTDVATQAARWGADQELEACINWMVKNHYWGQDGLAVASLRAARRPELPSLKEQALKSVAAIENMSDQYVQFEQDIDTIRRALESLPE